jgi:hypothetical protein
MKYPPPLSLRELMIITNQSVIKLIDIWFSYSFEIFHHETKSFILTEKYIEECRLLGCGAV